MNVYVPWWRVMFFRDVSKLKLRVVEDRNKYGHVRYSVDEYLFLGIWISLNTVVQEFGLMTYHVDSKENAEKFLEAYTLEYARRLTEKPYRKIVSETTVLEALKTVASRGEDVKLERSTETA